MTYDLVLIGTSPGMLLEAINASRSGDEVLVIDAQRDIGGAWSCISALGHEGLECGPHFFQSAPDLSVLKDEFEFAVTTVPKIRWKIHVRTVRLECSDRSAKIIAQLLIVASRGKSVLFGKRGVYEDRWSDMRRSLREIFFLIFQYREARQYLLHGSGPIVQNIYQAAMDGGVRFMNERIVELRKSDEFVSIGLETGKKIRTKKVGISTRTVLTKVKFPLFEKKLDSIDLFRNQIFLKVRTKTPVDFYAYRSIGCGFFAVANLSLIQNARSEPNEYLLVMTLSDMGQPLDIVDFQTYLDQLVSLNILPNESTLIGGHSSVYRDSRHSMSDYECIVSRSEGMVECLGDIDFARWIEMISAKWIKA